MTDNSFIKDYYNKALISMLTSIKLYVSEIYIRNILDEDLQIRPSELCKLNMDVFRKIVKSIVKEYSYYLSKENGQKFYRYFTRMNNKQLAKKFHYNEINYYYAVEIANEIAHRLPNKY